MGTTSNKLTYLNNTKTLIKQTIENKGVDIPDDATFRSYPNYINTLTNTNDATATPSDIVAGKSAYVVGEKITGILNPNDSFSWKPDPKWWDIYNIIQNDTTQGYYGRLILLMDDNWLYTEFKTADAYRTSDGAFYTSINRTTAVRHNWTPIADLTPDQYEENGYKVDSRGYTTKYVILYFNTSVTPQVDGTLLGFYPVYAVGKDLNVPFLNFLRGTYALQGYDHINCQYTGANATSFLGSNTTTALSNGDFQHFPDDIDFSNVTNFIYATQGESLRRGNWSTLDWKKLTPTTYLNVMVQSRSLDEYVGTIDLSKYTGNSFEANWIRIRKINVVGVKSTMRIFSQSTMPYSTMLDIVKNFTYQETPITITMSASLKTLSTAEIYQYCTSNNITLAQ